MTNSLALIIAHGMAQGLNPAAIARRIEREFTMIEIHLCRDCGQPMEALLQEQRQAPPLTIITCKNRACSLWSVTLSLAQAETLTEVEWQGYRESVARLKKTLGMENKS